jgi:hypothetical protein
MSSFIRKLNLSIHCGLPVSWGSNLRFGSLVVSLHIPNYNKQVTMPKNAFYSYGLNKLLE